MKRILLAAMVLSSLSGYAQSVNITKVEVDGDNMIVNYTLESPNAGHRFLLNLYSSKDNFSAPLAKVTGDIGQEVKPGDNRIVWNVRQEYGNYKGRMALEVRGRVYVPFVKLQNFTSTGSYKRGKLYDVIWKPGNADPLNIELYKGDQRVQGSMAQPNNGSFTLNIPSNTSTGKDYKLKITSTRSNDEFIYTPAFTVKPKVGVLMKALVPIAVIGGVVAGLGGSGSKSSGTNNTKTELPVPPFPTN
jgi:hypothetical protein